MGKKFVWFDCQDRCLRKLNKADHRDSQIQTEEFNGEPISALHYKFREGQPMVFI